MKANIHPTWHHDCKVTCSCGNTFVIGSVFPTLEIDICNQCHPFFTGEVKFVDRQGRVDRFKKKIAVAQAAKQKSSGKSKSSKAGSKQTDTAQSYKEILREQQAQLREATKKTDATPAN